MHVWVPVHVYVWIRVCVCMCMPVCECTWNFVVFEGTDWTVSSRDLRILSQLSQFAGRHMGFNSPIQVYLIYVIFVGIGDLDSGPNACEMSTLSTRISLQSKIVTILFLLFFSRD